MNHKASTKLLRGTTVSDRRYFKEPLGARETIGNLTTINKMKKTKRMIYIYEYIYI